MSKKTTRHIINFQFPTTLNFLSSLHLRIKLLKKEKIIKNKRKEKRTKKFRDTIEFNSFFLSTYTYFFPNLQQNSEPKFIITSPEQADGKESVPGMVEIEKSLFILLSLPLSLSSTERRR